MCGTTWFTLFRSRTFRFGHFTRLSSYTIEWFNISEVWTRNVSFLFFRILRSFLFFFRLNIYFSHQLANALEYLFNLNIIHGDIATRNCLFFSNLTIKLTDCAMALAPYEHEYWMCINGEKIPLRWIAPEALTVGNFEERILFYREEFLSE